MNHCYSKSRLRGCRFSFPEPDNTGDGGKCCTKRIFASESADPVASRKNYGNVRTKLYHECFP